MQVANKAYIINQEEVCKQPTALSAVFTLVAAIALTVLLGVGAALAAGALLKASVGLEVVVQLSAALGAIIGVIICLSKNIRARSIHAASPEIKPCQPPCSLRSEAAPCPPRSNFEPSSPRLPQSPYRSTNSPRLQESPSKAEYFPVLPVKGRLGGIKLTAIQKLKLMSTPLTPSKRKQYRCMIEFRSGKQEIHVFNANIYNAFLKFLPHHKKDTY